MKKKLFFVLVLLNSLHTSPCVRNGTDYFGLNKKWETGKLENSYRICLLSTRNFRKSDNVLF